MEWGFELFATHPFQGTGCSSEERTGAGGFLQLAWLDLEASRLTLGAHAGGELARAALALTGELGGTYRFGSERGFGIHTGVMAETVLLNTAARYQWLRNEAWVGGGVRVFGTYGPPTICQNEIGRPLRTASGLFALQSRSQGALAANTGRRIEAVGLAYERDAQLEHASVPAFLQLAAELARLHAPAPLIARALEAARDEQRHTELCMRLARRHLERCAVPALPAVVQRQR